VAWAFDLAGCPISRALCEKWEGPPPLLTLQVLHPQPRMLRDPREHLRTHLHAVVKRPHKLLAIDDTEREVVEVISAKMREVDRPPLRGILYGLDRLPKGIVKPFRRRQALATIPVQGIQIILLGLGMKLEWLASHSNYFP
jgi:hypothetical protein